MESGFNLFGEDTSDQTNKKTSTTEILGHFGKRISSIIDEVFVQKSAELEERERIVQEREAKVDHILKNNHMKGRIKLQVGNNTYDTQSDILLSSPDSYFHGLLNKEFLKDKEYDGDYLFVARDGETFKYVLEHLTYGQIISEIDESMLKKLEVDAKFYILPRLQNEVALLKKQLVTPIGEQEHLKTLVQSVDKLASQHSKEIQTVIQSIDKTTSQQAKQVETLIQSIDKTTTQQAKQVETLIQSIDKTTSQQAKQVEASIQSIDKTTSQQAKHVETLIEKLSKGISLMCCRFSNASCSGGSGYFWSWNKTDEIIKNCFQLSTKSQENDTVTILMPGFYHILVRTCCQTSTNYYSALYLNGGDVARSYSSSSSNYYNSFHINEFRKLKANDTLQIYQTYSSQPMNGDPYNMFQIIRYGD